MEQSRHKIDFDPEKVDNRFHKILSFDPAIIYEKIGHIIKPYSRFQNFGMADLFPNDDGKCACGCGKIPTGRRKRWYSDACIVLPEQILRIINGHSEFITRCLYEVYGMKCSVCSKTNMELRRPNENDWRSPIELEHTIPIKHGGGGAWLSGYTLQCFICHREKTNKDFGFKQKYKNQIELL